MPPMYYHSMFFSHKLSVWKIKYSFAAARNDIFCIVPTLIRSQLINNHMQCIERCSDCNAKYFKSFHLIE